MHLRQLDNTPLLMKKKLNRVNLVKDLFVGNNIHTSLNFPKGMDQIQNILDSKAK